MFDYYKAWDKFADKAVADVEKDVDSDKEDGDFIPATNPDAVEVPKPTT